MSNDTNQRNSFRIFAFVNAFWMVGQGLGGGDRRAIAIFERLKAKGIDVIIITSKMGYDNYRNRLDTKYIVVPVAFADRFGLLISYMIRSIVACFLKLNLERNDILYSTSDFLPDVLPSFIHKLMNKNVRWVQIIHHLLPQPSNRRGSFSKNFLSYVAQRTSLFFLKNFADLVIVVNPFVKSELEKRGFNKIKQSSNGIDVSYFEGIKPNKERSYDAIFLGRLHQSKGIFDLVEIWSYVVERADATLGIIGGGSRQIKDGFKKKIKERKLEKNIDVLGYLEDDEAFAIIKASAIFLFPSHEEGFGISICEAMGCGLPVVTWDLPIYREIYDNAIITIHENDLKEFANQILNLLTDRQLYECYRQNAIKVASRYAWDQVAEKELDLLKAIS